MLSCNGLGWLGMRRRRNRRLRRRRLCEAAARVPPNVAASEPRLEPLPETALVTGRRRSTRGILPNVLHDGDRARQSLDTTTDSITAESEVTTTDSITAEGKAPPPLVPGALLQELCSASCVVRVRVGMGAPHTKMIT